MLEDATFCPYCECQIEASDDGHDERIEAPSVLARTFLGVGVVFFAVVAFACLVAAFVI